MENLKFKYIGEQQKVLTCAVCEELLYYIDIQHYSKCPYCDAELNMDEELEEYVLKPVIDHWASSISRPITVRKTDKLTSNITL
jgi:phage FluMu protein Com